jgi:hypothetical protein
MIVIFTNIFFQRKKCFSAWTAQGKRRDRKNKYGQSYIVIQTEIDNKLFFNHKVSLEPLARTPPYAIQEPIRARPIGSFQFHAFVTRGKFRSWPLAM